MAIQIMMTELDMGIIEAAKFAASATVISHKIHILCEYRPDSLLE